MLRQALRQLRHRPSRLISTLIAIVLSVGFLTAAIVFTDTEFSASAVSTTPAAAKADLVIGRVAPEEGAMEPDRSDPVKVAKALKGISGLTFTPSFGQLIQLEAGATTSFAVAEATPADQSLWWFSLTQGRLPQTATEVAISSRAAAEIGVTVGDTVNPSLDPLTVVGLLDAPSTLFGRMALVSPAYFPHGNPQVWVTRTSDPAAAQAIVEQRLTEAGIIRWKAMLADEYRDTQLTLMGDGVNPFLIFLLGFAVIALLVGGIIIATTFGILLAQRRRQLGLLRLVGASLGQVRRSLFAEALVIGVLGSAAGLATGIGVAAAASAWTGSLGWGLKLPWHQLLPAALIGVLVTVLSAAAPILKGTRVTPMEAIRPGLGGPVGRRWSWLRAALCAVLLGGGFTLADLSRRIPDSALELALGAGVLLTIGTLAATPLFVPPLARVIGLGFRGAGPVGALAVLNIRRNPGRSAITASALMLAIGLMVTLQVSASSAKETLLTTVNVNRPVDVMLIQNEGKTLPPDVIQQAINAPGVTGSAVLSTGQIVVSTSKGFTDGFPEGIQITAIRLDAAAQAVLPDLVLPPEPGRLGVSRAMFGPDAAGESASIEPAEGGSVVSVRLAYHSAASSSVVMLTPSDFDAVVKKPVTSAVWLEVDDRSQTAASVNALNRLTNSTITAEGGLLESFVIESVLNMLLLISSSLLGIAVLISLIGVGNTLGLSVLERTQENAVLRALGLQPAGLRGMLALEALLLALVATIVGVLAGIYFGWLGVTTVLTVGGAPRVLVFNVDPWWTGGAAVSVLVAALLASLLPGIRAARVSPAEALSQLD